MSSTRRACGLVALLAAACSPARGDEARPRSLQAEVAAVGSRSVQLRLGLPAEATAVRVLLSAEPPDADGAAPALAQVVARPALDDDACTIEDLAPAVDTFLRVEIDTPAGRQAQDLTARTRGGPRARLDDALREVHLVGPAVLEVVLDGGDGAAWQRGPWSVRRRNGRAIPVVAVHRESVPTGQPDYPIGFGAEGGSDRVQVDHRLFLKLGAPVGTTELLDLRGPEGLHVRLPFSDRWLETPVVQLNQVGYNPRARHRWAYVSAWLGDGGGMPLDDFPEAAELLVEQGRGLPRQARPGLLPIRPRAARDADAGAPVREVDLAAVSAAEGARLRLRIPGVGVSWPTEVSERAATKAFFVVARGLFLNRWAGDLRPSWTDWSRPRDHGRVFTAEGRDPLRPYPEDTPRRGERALVGGHHDAGDFDLRPMHTAVAQLLLRAVELRGDALADRQLALPESGNGLPDLLDEALWSLEAWKALQERDGGVRAGAESFREPWGYYAASDDPLPYWTFARDADVSARVAGLFAQASRLVATRDSARAQDLRARAVRAWRWAKAHGARDASSLYALSELSRLTGDPSYARALEALWPRFGSDGPWSRMALQHAFQSDYFADARPMPDFLLGYLGAPGASPELVATSRRILDAYADRAATETLASAHAHRTPRGERGVDWGGGAIVARHLDPIVARLQLGGLPEDRRQDFFDALSLAADYMLGGNPLGMSFVTGLGSRRPEEPLHLDSLVFVRAGRPPLPGIPVYGPVRELPGASYYRPARDAFHPRFEARPLMRRYADVRTFPNTNEFTVWDCQAPAAQLFALLVGAGARPPERWLPGRAGHDSPLPD